jgi:hypothetical protein
MARSILQKEKECWLCGTTYDLHDHHIYFGHGKRKISERNGFKVWLCGRHHNLSEEGVHFDRAKDIKLKQICQRKYEETNTRVDFMKLIGRNYLEE